MEKKLASFKVYLKMAKDLEGTEPVIALCCRMYYLEKYLGLKKQANLQMSPEENAELTKVLDAVSKTKKLYPMSKEEIKDMLEDFCGKNFVRMDKEDHTAPKLTKEHASRFNTTAHFIQLLSTYDAMTPKWEEKSILEKKVVKYCKLKASSILKCLKQGVDPPRGNPNNPDPPPGAESKSEDAKAPDHPPNFQPPVQHPSAGQFISPPSFNQPSAPPAGYGVQPPRPGNFPLSQLPTPSPQLGFAGGSQPASAVVGRRKVDPKNPYNEMGKIVRQHPKYFDVVDKAQKLLEHAMTDLNSKGLARAVKNLEDAYKLLDQLEN